MTANNARDDRTGRHDLELRSAVRVTRAFCSCGWRSSGYATSGAASIAFAVHLREVNTDG